MPEEAFDCWFPAKMQTHLPPSKKYIGESGSRTAMAILVEFKIRTMRITYEEYLIFRIPEIQTFKCYHA